MIIDTHAHITCDALYARKEEVIEHVLLSRIEKNLKELKKAFYKNRPRR